jgi:enoyl-CoA hydratase/carnithine racemase
MNPRTFLFSESGGVGTLTLNRPERLNALTFEVYAELRDALRDLRKDRSVRALVLTGAGRGFCSGGDRNDIIAKLIGRPAAEIDGFARMTCDVIANLRALDQPVIAAVNGAAVGAGAVLAIASDVRLASEAARFGFVFPQVGLSGADMGACWLLPRIVGLGRASELLLTGDVIDAERALQWGLVNRIVPADRLLAEAQALARRLATGPVRAHAVTRRMLQREATLGLEEALEAEARAQAELMRGPDFGEAFRASVEQRPPRFEGAAP